MHCILATPLYLEQLRIFQPFAVRSPIYVVENADYNKLALICRTLRDIVWNIQSSLDFAQIDLAAAETNCLTQLKILVKKKLAPTKSTDLIQID